MARASGLTYEQVRYRRRQVLKRLRKRLKERGVRPVPIDTTPVPIWYGNAAGCDSPNGVTGARATTQGSRVHRLEGQVAPKELGLGESPIWCGKDNTDTNDDYTTSVTAVLPTEPPTLVGAAAREEGGE
jgi:hypothetical protein